MFEAGLVSLLNATAGLTAIVGNRIYPVKLPDETESFPALTYQVVSASPEWALDRTKYEEKRVQFDAWANLYGDCKAVAKQLEYALDGFDGTLPDGTRVISTIGDVQIDEWQSDARVHRLIAEYIFQFTEA
jgi:hypothetical protein